MVPGWIRFGSEPMTCRLAAYRAGQPPRTPRAAAIEVRVSPGRTAQVSVDAAASGAAVTASRLAGTLAGATWVLLAMLVLAWAGCAGPPQPVTAKRNAMPRAATTHADFVHLRTMGLFLPECQRQTLLVRRRGHEPGEGRELSRGNLRQDRTPDRLGPRAPLQPQQEQQRGRESGAPGHGGTAAGTTRAGGAIAAA